jgi:hypothetical protein
MVTGKSFPLFPEATGITTDGSWSPDGRKIVFSVSSHDYVFPPGNIVGDMYRMYSIDFNPEAFGKPTVVAEALPAGFAVTGNHPNPFNPSTTISFTLPGAGAATLAVYDITGRRVRDLVNGNLASGAHSAVWDGCDASGRAMSSGVYFSRLVWNGRTTANRMLLAK